MTLTSLVPVLLAAAQPLLPPQQPAARVAAPAQQTARTADVRVPRSCVPGGYGGERWREYRERFEAEVAAAKAGGAPIVFLGDSITHNWEAPGRGREVWERHFATGRFRAVNFGIKGDSTCNLIYRLQHGVLDGFTAKAVILQIGTNNLRNDSPEDIRLGVKACIDLIREKQSGATVILHPVPMCAERPGDLMRRQAIAANAELAQLVDGRTVLWCDWSHRMLRPDGTIPKSVIPDTCHPLRPGYELWAEALLPILERVLGPDADILVNKPDFFVFTPTMPLAWQRRKIEDPSYDPHRRGDCYNDHFQVLADEKRRQLFAFWTQATYEGCCDQHIAFARSSDQGRSWTAPVVLAGGECRAYPKLRASWQQPMLSRSGRLYCLWNQQTTSRGPHCGEMFGSYSDDAGETWSEPKQVPFPRRMDQDPADPLVPPSWCNWQRPLRLGEGGRFFVGCSRHGKAPYDAKSCCKIEFWQFDNIDDDPNVEGIALSQFATNRDMLAADKVAPIPGVKYFTPTWHPWGHPEDPAVEEASVMKLPDGRLFAVMRSSIGCPVWSQSRDQGRTWSSPKALLDAHGKPFPHPRSPCPFYDWKGPEAGSGLYFGLVHMKFDMSLKTAYQPRGPLYLVAGRFDPHGEQPVKFGEPRLFAPRSNGNSFYSSYTVLDGKGVLWFNDRKYYLLGRTIGPEWMESCRNL